jgi:uncharacterized small protein (TIGR04563 family)
MSIDPAILARQRGFASQREPERDEDDDLEECPRIGAEKPGPKPIANPKSKYAKRRMSLYFPEEIAEEIRDAAVRMQRSESWVLRYAWKHGRDAVAQLPSIKD